MGFHAHSGLDRAVVFSAPVGYVCLVLDSSWVPLRKGTRGLGPKTGVSMIIGCAAMMKVFIGYTGVSVSAT